MRLIDADALMAEMKEYRSEHEKEQMHSGDRGICVTWNDAMFFIKNAPTIEPEPSQVTRDIAAIIENEKDMRVIAQNAKSQWIPCSEPPDSNKNVFIAHGTENFMTCCIGHYDHESGIWYEDRNWFAKPIFDNMYWCEMPILPKTEE